MSFNNAAEYSRSIRPEHYFFMKNGFIVKNLEELKQALKEIDDSVFSFHVNSSKNDFAEWIGNCIGDNTLRNTVLQIKDKESLISLLSEYGKTFSGKVSESTDSIFMDAPLEDETLEPFIPGNYSSYSGFGFLSNAEEQKPAEKLEGSGTSAAKPVTTSNAPLDSPPETPQDFPFEPPPDVPPDIPPDEASDDSTDNAGEQSSKKESPSEENSQSTKETTEEVVEETTEEFASDATQESQKSPEEKESSKTTDPPEEQKGVESIRSGAEKEKPEEVLETKGENHTESKVETDTAPEEKEPRSENDADTKVAKDKGQTNLEVKPDTITNEELVEIREIEIQDIGVKELDSIYKMGLPRICNLLFVGKMSTGKTITSLKMILAAAKKGEKALYISFQDSEEKIINIMKSIDKDILEYVNSGNIMIKKLNPFEIVKSRKIKDQLSDGNLSQLSHNLEFVEIFGPRLVVVDSLSALALSFTGDMQSYRQYIDSMFEYFEKIGVMAVYIKELKSDNQLNREFFENILSDSIVFFSKDNKGKVKLKVVKEYHFPKEREKKGIFGFLSGKKI